MDIEISTDRLGEIAGNLRAGDRVLLNGTVYTARDAAHKRIFALLDAGEQLPFPLEGAVIYYAGPTPAPAGFAVGSCGPTTSSRMDKFTPRLLENGLRGMIGKGERSAEVVEAIRRSGAVYFCAIGGAGALAAQCVSGCEEVAFHELGCESVKRLTLEGFPVIVGIDTKDGNIFEKIQFPG